MRDCDWFRAFDGPRGAPTFVALLHHSLLTDVGLSNAVGRNAAANVTEHDVYAFWNAIRVWGDAHNVAWGDVPTWLAFAGAVVAAIFAGRIVRIERARDCGAARDRIEAQADQVSVWMDSRLPGDGAAPSPYAGAKLVNRSNQPVYKIGVVVEREDGHTFEIGARHVLPPNTEWKLALPDIVWRELSPDFPHTPTGRLHPAWRAKFEEIRVAVVFKDVAGVQWMRTFSGGLTRFLETPTDDLGDYFREAQFRPLEEDYSHELRAALDPVYGDPDPD